MYVARFSYDVSPANRQRAIDLIRDEVSAAMSAGYVARMLVPITRPPGGAALVFEVDIPQLDDLETLRHRGPGQSDISQWASDLSEILIQPPHVELLRIVEPKKASSLADVVDLHPAGQHARPDLTDDGATSGTGALPEANQRTIEPGTG
jgi:hypothetical protein